MNAHVALNPRRSLPATFGLVACGALLLESLLLLALLPHSDAPALRAVLGGLFKAVAVAMMHYWPALLTVVFGVVLLASLGFTLLDASHPFPEDGR